MDIIVSFLAAVLAGTGVGGGGLLIIYLSAVKNFSQLACQGINLAFFESGALSALPIHIRHRNYKWGAVLTLGIAGLFGALIGFTVAEKLGSDVLKYVVGVFFVLTGIRELFKKPQKSQKN